MARLSRTTKEIINTVIFLLVVATLLTAFVCYPLNRTQAFLGRPDIDDFNEDSLVANDAALYVEAGFVPDTFRVESDGLTNIACLYIATLDSADTVAGTVFLLHNDGANRDSLLDLARAMHSAGYAVVAYDQRASGRSTGRYRGGGRFEANDLVEVIRYLDIRGRIIHPVYAVGYGQGGDATILTALEDDRIDGVVAIAPYLSSKRLLDILRERHNPYWTPLYRTMLWWWYDIRSGYSAQYRDLENIEPVACRTLIMLPAEAFEDEEVARITELSSPDLLTVETIPTDRAAINDRIVGFLMQAAPAVD